MKKALNALTTKLAGRVNPFLNIPTALMMSVAVGGFALSLWMAENSMKSDNLVVASCCGSGSDSCDCGCEDNCEGSTISVTLEDGDNDWGWTHIEKKHIDDDGTGGTKFPSNTKKTDISGAISSLACEDHGTEKTGGTAETDEDGNPKYHSRWNFAHYVIVNGRCGKVHLVATEINSGDGHSVTTMYPDDNTGCECVCNNNED